MIIPFILSLSCSIATIHFYLNYRYYNNRFDIICKSEELSYDSFNPYVTQKENHILDDGSIDLSKSVKDGNIKDDNTLKRKYFYMRIELDKCKFDDQTFNCKNVDMDYTNSVYDTNYDNDCDMSDYITKKKHSSFVKIISFGFLQYISRKKFYSEACKNKFSKNHFILNNEKIMDIYHNKYSQTLSEYSINKKITKYLPFCYTINKIIVECKGVKNTPGNIITIIGEIINDKIIINQNFDIINGELINIQEKYFSYNLYYNHLYKLLSVLSMCSWLFIFCKMYM